MCGRIVQVRYLLTVIIAIGLCVFSGCASPSGPLATLPMTSPMGFEFNLEGIRLFNQGQWAAARDQFERAVRADPGLAEAHFNLALTYHKLGRHEEAKREFILAGELAPQSRHIIEDSSYRNHLGLSSTFERHISGGYRY